MVAMATAIKTDLSEDENNTLFTMLFMNDQRSLERALMSLATISFTENSKYINNFYEQKVIERLLKVVNQLENRTSYYALDALR